MNQTKIIQEHKCHIQEPERLNLWIRSVQLIKKFIHKQDICET